MHDFSYSFPVGRAPAGAGAGTIRRVRVRVRRWHPDLDGGAAPNSHADFEPVPADVAVDFIDMSAVVDRIHAAFFHHRR